jgi:hypothetical protein
VTPSGGTTSSVRNRSSTVGAYPGFSPGGSVSLVFSPFLTDDRVPERLGTARHAVIDRDVERVVLDPYLTPHPLGSCYILRNFGIGAPCDEQDEAGESSRETGGESPLLHVGQYRSVGGRR